MQWWQLHIRYGVSDYHDTIMLVSFSVLHRVLIITATATTLLEELTLLLL